MKHSKTEEKAIEIAKEILSQEEPNFEYDEIMAKRLENTPLHDVIFINTKTKVYRKIRVEVTDV